MEGEAENFTNKPAAGMIGSIVAFAGPADRIPSNWVPCDGRELSQAKYGGLFDRIGLRYSAGDHVPSGTSTANGMFRVPNLSGRVLVGAGHGHGLTDRKLSALGGREQEQLIPTMDEIGGQNHHTTFSKNLENPNPVSHTQAHRHTISAMNVEKLPPFMALIYIICTR